MSAQPLDKSPPRVPAPPGSRTDSGRQRQEYPLSPVQQGLLFHSQLAPEPGVYIQQMVGSLHEDLSYPAFRRAWEHVVQRHPILCTCFRLEGTSEPAQVVQGTVALPVDEQDWRCVPAAEQEERLQAFLETDRRRGFDLTQAPLMRLALVRRADAETTCVWTYHHLLLDGRSHTMILKEVFACYEAFCQGREPHLEERRPYRDYIDWLGQQDWSKAEAHWKQVLRAFRAPTPLLAVAPAPGTAFAAEPAHGKQTYRLPAELTTRLQAFAQQHELTLNTLIQGAFAVLLSRYSGEEDVVFGATRACRRSTVPGAPSMVGLFINTVPFRALVSPEISVLAFLKDLRTQAVAVRPYEHTPLLKIQEWSEVPRGMPLFETILIFENDELTDALRTDGGNWAQREFQLLEETNYPLALRVHGGKELLLAPLYLRRRFDDATIARLFGHLRTLLEGMLAHPEQRVAALPLLTEAEHRQVVYAWNDTAAEYPRDRCIHQLFEAQAARTPDATALVFEGQPITYRALNERANQLAHYLRSIGVGPGVFVGISVERGPRMIVGVLGITKAGGAYVPLDPAYPKDRLAFMVEDTQAPVLLTQQNLLERFPETKARMVCLDQIEATLAQQSTENPTSGVTTGDLAYIIYTSGSTGKPKGVVLRHNPVVNLIDWVNRTYPLGPGDRSLFVTSLNFDLSVYDVFGVLATGASVRITSAGELRDPEQLVKILCQEPITFWDSAPPQLQQLAPFFPTALQMPGKRHLRLVFLSGDWIPVPLPDAVRATFPAAQLVSLGGATEAAIWSNFYPIGVVDPKWPSIPYGKPIQNARYHILDRNLNPLPVGVAGELHIGGRCLADGYLNRPELNAEKFIPDPFAGKEEGGRMKDEDNSSFILPPSSFPARLYKTGDLARYFPDGNMEFMGRMDFQVKIRGFRIELGEIEAVISQHAGVRESLVTALKDDSGGRYLCAYVVPRPGQSPSATELREFLQAKLPAHMVPPHFVTLDAFPLSANGKIDRKALPAPQQSADGKGARTIVAPRTDAERDLAPLWEEVLKVKPISITDNFFDLGGHSLMAAVLVGKIRQQLGHTVPLGALFGAPTVEKLASVLTYQLEAGTASSIVPLHDEGSKPPLFMIAGVGGHVFTFSKFARLLGDDQPVYGVKAIGVDGVQTPPETIEAMAAYYVREITALRPHGPYLLSGFSIGALVAYELAVQLQALGHEVGPLIVFDMFAPGYPRKLPRMQRLWLHLRTFLRLGLGEKKAYVGERLGKLKVRVRHWLGQDIRNAPEVGVEGLSQDNLKRVWLALISAQQRYYPQRQFDGKVVLFKAVDSFHWPATILDDPLFGWGQWARGGVEVQMVPGSHMEIFHDKNIRLVARELLESLNGQKTPV